MKSLSKIELKDLDAVELSKEQMKQISGSGVTENCNGSCTGDCVAYLNDLRVTGKCEWVDASGYLACGCRIY